VIQKILLQPGGFLMKVKSMVVVIAFLVFGLSIAFVQSPAFGLDESVITIATGTDYETGAPEEDPMGEGDEGYISPEQEQGIEWDQEDIMPEEESDSEDDLKHLAPEEDPDYETY
jgi:hypothetical protein